MLVVVLFALGRAFVASLSAKLEHLDKQLFVASRSPKAEASGRLADIGAIAAKPDALGHVHIFGGTDIGAAEAHFRTIHGVMDGIAQRLVDVARFDDVRMQRNHLADRHFFLPV